MYRGYKRSRRPQQLGFCAELLLLRAACKHVLSKRAQESRRECSVHASKRVAVVSAAKKCFWRNLKHWLPFNSSQCFFNRKKRLNELHVDGLLGGGKERVEWVSEERREKKGGGVRNQEMLPALRFLSLIWSPSSSAAAQGGLVRSH